MNRLRELRKQHGLTQDELGQALGVQKAAICKYETGRVPLPNDALMQLCSIFHVTADYILGRDTVTTMFKERGSSSALFMPVTDTVGVPLVGRVIIVSLPFLAFGMMLHDIPAFVGSFFHNESVPPLLLVWGSAGQVIFTLRFIYQWYYSYRRHESVLPVGFWIISLVGCSIIVSYGIFRLDPVLIIGQSVGFFTYSRNIVLYRKNKRK